MNYPTQQKPLTLSLIIPVFNEEHYIKRCLDAVAAQSRMPDEVIVVDNNCSDSTIEIAREYSFVRIVSEPRQGRAWARSAGFDQANSDILGRIDADSVIAPDWCEKVISFFTADPDLGGVTGLAKSDIIPFVHFIKSTLPSRGYFWFVHANFRTLTMWGANMAIRASAWQKVREKVVMDDRKVHEDQDLSLWMADQGLKIIQKNELLITIDGQSYRYLPKSIYYTRLLAKTKKLHSRKGNLTASRTRDISGFHVALDLMLGSIVGSYVLLLAVISFPIDYFLIKSKHKNIYRH